MILLEYFECQCGVKDHLLVVEKDTDGLAEIYMQINSNTLWSRLKWLFTGNQSRWCSTLIREENVKRLLDVLGN